MLERILYRGRQFFNIASANLKEDERRVIELLLNPAQRELFNKMPRLGQRHCLNVYCTLKARGCEDRDLLRAALLHDVGKEGVGLWHRVACVILGRVCPRLLGHLADGRPGSWRYGFYSNLNHAQRGATLVEASGASAVTVALIRLHQDKGKTDPLLLAFQEADEAN